MCSWGDCWGVGEELVDFAGDVAFEAAEDLSAGLALRGAPGGVGLGALVAAEADHGDAPEGVVGLAVAASVQPVAHGAPRGGFDGGGAAERGEGSLVC